MTRRLCLVLAISAAVLPVTAQSVFVECSLPFSLKPTSNVYTFYQNPLDALTANENASVVSWPAVHAGYSHKLSETFYALGSLGLYGIRTENEIQNSGVQFSTDSYTLPALIAEVGIGARLTTIMGIEVSAGADLAGAASRTTASLHGQLDGGHQLFLALSRWQISQYVNTSAPAGNWVNYSGYDANFTAWSAAVGYRLVLDKLWMNTGRNPVKTF